MVLEFLPRREPGWLERGLLAVFGAPLNPRHPDPARLILWVPVAFGLGAAAYFLPSSEPAHWLLPYLLFTSLALIADAGFARANILAVYALVLTGFLLAGFAIAQWRTLDAAPPAFETSERAVTLVGWIEAVERGGSRPRIRLRVTEMSGAEHPPERVRVRVGLGAFGPGDTVSMRAVLTRPPGPAAPGGYDPARAAWYDRVALTGFAISELSLAEPPNEHRLVRALASYRWQLAERIRDKAGAETGGIAAALLTGDRSGVRPEDAETLRVSGLGHILAISGLHMALFAGGIYFAVRFALASVDRYARAHDPRKPAAAIALLAATGYLILSGAAIPTQRAWVMAGVVLIGVMLDRRAFSMRSLALAAMVVIFLAPESVVEAGFQMSFAAVAALIAVYEVWSKLRPEVSSGSSLLGRATDAFGGLAMTSVIAGGATGAFAAFHFQRIAAYGLIANLAAMPVFTFWVMPAGVIALALAPVGLDGPALAVMDLGLDIVLAIGRWTESLSGAGVSVIAADGKVIALYAIGFAATTLGLGLIRAAGLATCAAALGLWVLQSPSDLMITDDGVVIARFDDSGAFQASSLRASRFERNVFLQRAGQEGAGITRASLACDPAGCVGTTLDGVVIAFADTAESLAEDCQLADLVVYAGSVSPWRTRRCQALLVSAEELSANGSLEFETRDGRLTLRGAAQDQRRDRIWSAPT